MAEYYPVNSGNAEHILENICLPCSLVMIKYEELFDYYAEEPYSLTVQKKAGCKNEKFYCVFRVRTWNDKNGSNAWTIYSKGRKNFNNIILRKVHWDMEEDKKYAKEHIKDERTQVLRAWPRISTYHKNYKKKNTDKLRKTMQKLDEIMENGFLLHETDKAGEQWREIEILRHYDWGQVHVTWDTSMRNKAVIKRTLKLIREIEYLLEKHMDDVYYMGLNYSITPETYKTFYEKPNRLGRGSQK